MKSDFLCIYNNKLDVSGTLQLTVTVSHRRHFCLFVTNSWLLRTDTQTHLMSYVCEWRSLQGPDAPGSITIVILLFFH